MKKKILLPILLFLGITSANAQQGSTNIVANYDTYLWPSTALSLANTTFNVIENDTFGNLTPGTGFIFSGSNKNATITTEGIWPSGINLSSSGVVSFSTGAILPSDQLKYKICDNNGNCTFGYVIFTDFRGGNIELRPTNSSTTICENQIVRFGNGGISGVTSQNGLAAASYTYEMQVSNDNGATWESVSLPTVNGIDQYEYSYPQGTYLVRRKVTAGWLSISNLPDIYSYTPPIKLTVIKNKITYSSDNNFVIRKGSTITFPQITTTYPSTVTIIDTNGNPVTQGSTRQFNEPGDYVFTVTATNTTPSVVCPEYGSITVSVYDELACNQITQKVYASSQTSFPSTSVHNGDLALGSDLSNGSDLVQYITLLGIGTLYQNLKFTEKIDKGTPITIKFGQNYSLLQVGGGFTVAAIDQNGDTITPLKSLNEGGLLNLLQGQNGFEYTYIPTKTNGETVDYYGVRVVFGSAISLGSTGKVFGAYYSKTITDPNYGMCTAPANIVVNPDIKVRDANDTSTVTSTPITLNGTTEDVLWGVKAVASVATVASSIYDPYLAIDNDITTAATMVRALNVLDEASLTVKLRQVTKPGDQVRIILSKGNSESNFPNILSLSLLSDLKIQRYLGDKKVGPELDNTNFKLLNLDLFSIFTTGTYRNAVIVSGTSQPFDRVKISVRNVVNVGLLEQAYWKFYDVSVIPSIKFEGQGDQDATTNLCAGSFLQVNKNDSCTDYDLSIAYGNYSNNVITSYTEIANSNLIRIGDSTSRIFYSFKRLYPEHDGNLFLKVQTKRNGCNFGEPQYMKITLANCASAVTNPVISTK